MTLIQVIILSFVEGFTEFLPVSSTGHLILVSNILKVPQTEFLKSFEIIIQIGAILAVVFLYKNKLLKSRRIWSKILTAFIPTGIVGFFLYRYIRDFLLTNEIVTVISLFIGGIILIILEYKYKDFKNNLAEIENISYKKALFIGIIQSISVIPGISRAASAIIGGRLSGFTRESAVVFSFLLAIPTIFAAGIYDFTKNGLTFSNYEYVLLITGFTFSFCIAVITIKFFIKYIQKNTFISFGVYRVFLALVYWLTMINWG